MRYSGLILAALQSPLLDANNPYSLSHYRPPGAIPPSLVWYAWNRNPVATTSAAPKKMINKPFTVK